MVNVVDYEISLNAKEFEELLILIESTWTCTFLTTTSSSHELKVDSECKIKFSASYIEKFYLTDKRAIVLHEFNNSKLLNRTTIFCE